MQLPAGGVRAAALLLGFPGRPGDPEPGADLGAHAPERPLPVGV